MNPASITQVTRGRFEKYATTGDFCRIFMDKMSSLYQLSLLLTGDHDKAEPCFVAGFESSVKENLVSKRRTGVWAKRMIIINAIRMVAPHTDGTMDSALSADLDRDHELSMVHDKYLMITAVLKLADLERVVFVMSVLEQLPDENCSALLNCSQQEFREARTRALQGIAASHTTCASQSLEALRTDTSSIGPNSATPSDGDFL